MSKIHFGTFADMGSSNETPYEIVSTPPESETPRPMAQHTASEMNSTNAENYEEPSFIVPE